MVDSELVEVLDEIDGFSYPKTISEKAPFLPTINLKCATKAARNYLLGVEITTVPSSQPSISFEPSVSSLPTNIFHPTASPSNSPSLVPSQAPSLSSAPSDPSFYVPYKTTITGFFDAIAEGCSSESFSFGGGYNSTSEKLSMDIVANLGGSRNLNQALKTLASLVDLPLEGSFFEQLAILEDIELGGSLLIDFSIGAKIDRDVVNSTFYGSVTPFITINRFLVEAFLRTDQGITIEFPVKIPGTGVSPASELIFLLNGGEFDIDFSIELKVSMLDFMSNTDRDDYY